MSHPPSSQISLRLVLILPFVLQLFLAVGLTAWVSLRNGQEAVLEVTKQLRSEITSRIQERLGSYMAVPVLVNQITANAVMTGGLDLKAPKAGRHFWKQAQTFPEISFHYFGTPSGQFLSARRFPNGEVQVGLLDQSTGGAIQYFVPDAQGDRTYPTNTVPHFYPPARPWYQAAIAAGKPVWTPIYRHFVTKDWAITAAYPLYDAQGQIQGVLGTDFLLPQISQFLGSLQVGQTGETFIIERSGNMVSTSNHEQHFQPAILKTWSWVAPDTAAPLIQATNHHLRQRVPDLTQIKQSLQLTSRSITTSGLSK